MIYYEAHVTIEPIFDDRLTLAADIAKNHKFKIANLLMQKRQMDLPERSMYDTFMTAHGQSEEVIKDQILSLIEDLKKNDFKVWRYKIEDVIVDSKFNDILGVFNADL